MEKKKSGREAVIDTVAFVSNLKVVCFLGRGPKRTTFVSNLTVVCFLGRSPKWMTFKKMDYSQKIICLDDSHQFGAKSDNSGLNGHVFGFPVEIRLILQ